MIKRTLPVLLLALGLLPACNGGDGPTGPGATLQSLTIAPATLVLGVGDTTRLAPVGIDEQGDTIAAEASFKSSNSNVVSVSATGLATGVSAGSASIEVKSGGKTTTLAVTVVAGGSFHTFNVNATTGEDCSNPTYHGAKVVATSTHAVMYEDINNPTGGFTAAEYQSILAEFEAAIWPTDTQNFGTPTDLDGNGKIYILYTRSVNELTPPGANYIVGGFFYGRDLFPRVPNSAFVGCLGSNQAELVYMLAPDPSGTINGHQRSKDYVRRTTEATVAHEFQHLINTGRRLYVNNADDYETVYLDEGLSHVAEELVFYTSSGLTPRGNLTLNPTIFATDQRLNAFNTYMLQNTARYQTYLEAPEVNSPWDSGDELETRGATWNFLRYLADRRGGNDQAFWFALANSRTNGLANLQAALGSDPVVMARDWSVSVYADDAVPVSAAFTQPSWNFREIMQNAAFNPGFDLNVHILTNTPRSDGIKSGSAAYLKFGVAPATQADLRFALNGGTVAGACTTLNLAVGAVQQLTLGAGLALCLPGGVSGAEYVAIPYHGNPDSNITVFVATTSTGVVPPLGPPSPDRVAGAGRLFALDGESLTRPWDGGFEHRMREASRISAQRHVRRFSKRPSFDVSGAGVSTVTVNIVRTK